MPSASIITIRPRSLANVLDDLREARRDYDVAIADLGNSFSGTRGEADADDRATEAETRLEDLREEANALLLNATGLTFEALLAARETCLL